MDSFYSASYGAICGAWEAYARFFNSITPHDIIPLLTPTAIGYFTFQQWRISLETSRRHFSERLLEYLVPILEAQSLALKMLSLKQSYDENLEWNRFSYYNEERPFMIAKKEEINEVRESFQGAVKLAHLSMFKLILFLGLHRSDTPTEDRRYARLVQDKIVELLNFAFQCKAEIIDQGSFELDGKAQEPIHFMKPDEALKKLRKLEREMINLVTSKYSVTRL